MTPSLFNKSFLYNFVPSEWLKHPFVSLVRRDVRVFRGLRGLAEDRMGVDEMRQSKLTLSKK